MESFGVPTFLLKGEGTFVRYMKPSEDDNMSRELIDSLVFLLENRSDLNEFKHTQVPF